VWLIPTTIKERTPGVSISSPVIANSTARAAPRSINYKRGIRQQITRSMISFTESIV
jgi:hypothetical protein